MKRKAELSVVYALWFSLIFFSSCLTGTASVNRGKVFQCLTLDPKRDYIFYQVVTPGNHNEIWAVDPTDKRSVLLPEKLDSVQMTTPPGKDWILLNNNSIHILDLDVCETKPVYTLASEYKYFYTLWLSQDVVLINAFEEWPFSPDLYVLDLKTNKAEKVASEKWIQGVSTSHATWIQADGITVESATWQGSTRRILDEFEVDVENSPGSIQFSLDSHKFIFVAAQEDSTDFKIWRSDLRQSKPQIIFEPAKGSSIRYWKLSPNGRVLGIIVDAVNGYSLLFLNLSTNQIDFAWPYPYTRTNPELIWSPDSRYVAIPFEGEGEPPSFASHMGIQILAIETGKIDIVMDTGVTWLLGWYSAQ